MSKCMKRKLLCGCLVVGSLVGAPVAVNAAQVAIQNSGFELPDSANPLVGGGGLVFNGTPVPGWFSPAYPQGGQWDITNFPYGVWNVPAPQGKQVLYIGSTATPNYYEHTLLDPLEPNAMYTLTGVEGNPIGYQAPFTVELRSGANILSSFTGGGTIGNFQPFQVVFNSTGSAFVGGPLVIRLTSALQGAFDDIKLDRTAVPEPSTLVLLALGGLFALVSRKKVKVIRARQV